MLRPVEVALAQRYQLECALMTLVSGDLEEAMPPGQRMSMRQGSHSLTKIVGLGDDQRQVPHHFALRYLHIDAVHQG